MDTRELEVVTATPPPKRTSIGSFALGVVFTAVVAAVAWFAVDAARDDAPPITPVLSWLTPTVAVVEGEPAITMTARLTAPSVTTIEIGLTATGDRAGDLVLAPATLTIVAGSTDGFVTVMVPDDATLQGDSTLSLALQSASGVAVPEPSVSITVLDDEQAATQSPSTTTVTQAPSEPPPDQAPATVAPGQALSSVVPTLLGSDSAMQTASVTTPPFQLTADRLVLVSISTLTSNRRTEIPVLSGGGLQWDLVATQTRNEGPRRLSVFRAMATDSTSTAIQLDFGAAEGLIHWAVVEYDNVLPGANGANAVVQAAGNAAVGFESFGMVELAPFAHATNATVGVFFAGVTGIEPEQGYVELAELRSPKRTLATMFRGEADQVVATAEWSGGAHWLGIGIEIQAAPE